MQAPLLVDTHGFVVALVSAWFASPLRFRSGHQWLCTNYTDRPNPEERFEIERNDATRKLDANLIICARPDEEAPRSHCFDRRGRMAAASESIASGSVYVPRID